MTDAQDFGAYLRHAMDSAKLTAADLGRAAGVANSVVSRWFRGSVPSIENLRLLSPALGVPMRELVVAAGHLLPEEVGLAEMPQAPGPPPDIEDEIRADAYLSDDKKQALIAVLRALRAEYAENPPVRRQRGA